MLDAQSLTSSYGLPDPSLDVNYLSDPAITADNVGDLTAPLSNPNGSTGGFDFNAVTKSLLGLFDNGIAVYNDVASKVGSSAVAIKAARQQAQAPVVVSPVALGLTATQWGFVAAGVGLIVLLPMIRKAA